MFYDVEAYLRKTFPLLHEKLNLTKVNTHGLVYTWAGSDESLSPSLLMAHQDTVIFVLYLPQHSRNLLNLWNLTGSRAVVHPRLLDVSYV